MLGSCTPESVAGKVVTRVIGHYPERNQMLVDCGFTALTKQGKGCQDHPQMIAKVEHHDDLMLTNMTQVLKSVLCSIFDLSRSGNWICRLQKQGEY